MNNEKQFVNMETADAFEKEKKLKIVEKFNLSGVSDEELMKEMSKRFIVPQFYLKEHIEKWNINEDDFDDFKDFVYSTHLYNEIDDAMEEVAQNFLEEK